MSVRLELRRIPSFEIQNFRVNLVFQNPPNIYNFSKFRWENRPISMFRHIGTSKVREESNKSQSNQEIWDTKIFFQLFYYTKDIFGYDFNNNRKTNIVISQPPLWKICPQHKAKPHLLYCKRQTHTVEV